VIKKVLTVIGVALILLVATPADSFAAPGSEPDCIGHVCW
jgi:hypothetical protein